jgi:hypothetical protein
MGEATARTREFVEAEEKANRIQLVDVATHIRANCGDLVITDMLGRIAEVREMGRLRESDHKMTLVRIETGMRGNQCNRHWERGWDAS